MMKHTGMIIIFLFVASLLCGCQATMNKRRVGEVPQGNYKVTLVESDYGCLNHFGKNCVVLYDISDDRDLRLVYGGPKKELGDVFSDSIDEKGLKFYSITDDKGNVCGYLGFSEGQRAVESAVFDNGSVVVGSERISGDGDKSRRIIPLIIE